MTNFFFPLSIFTLGVCFTFTLGAGLWLLFAEKNRNRLTKILAYILLFYAVLFFKDILLFYLQFRENTLLYSLFLSVDNWSTPLCGIYLLAIVKPSGSTSLYKIALHVLPFILLSFSMLILDIPLAKSIIFGYTCLYGASVSAYFLFKSRVYRRLLKENYSYNENIDILWIYKLLVLFVFYIIIWLIVSRFESFAVDFTYYLFSLCLWIIVFFKGKNQEPIQIFPNKNGAKVETKPTELPISIDVWKTSRSFLNPKITLNEVATELGTNRTYLSNFLNHTLNTTFYDYVNNLRVDFAETMLSDAQNTDTLETVAEKSGFNSLSTFRRAFEKKNGCTPFEFRKTHVNGKNFTH